MVVAKISAYEKSRQKRLEENKKRMEELNLNKLVQSLHTLKPCPMKKVKPKVPRQPVDPSMIRRSSRVADKPPVSYKDDPIEPEGRSRTRSYGWRGFARYHKLVDGDALVFQITEPTTFKVIICNFCITQRQHIVCDSERILLFYAAYFGDLDHAIVTLSIVKCFSTN